MTPPLFVFNFLLSILLWTSNVNADYQYRVSMPGVALSSSPAIVFSSCATLLEAVPSTVSGWHTIDVDGTGPISPQQVYCDMVTEGGGWTLVVRQYEETPVSWEGGVNGNSFSLNAINIPVHAQVGFGKDTDSTFIDYANFQYTTGNIPTTVISGLKSGLTYHIHRDTGHHYAYHDPDSLITYADPKWVNTLTLDRTGGLYRDWAYGPSALRAPAERGTAMAGSWVNTSVEAYAWTVWVR